MTGNSIHSLLAREPVSVAYCVLSVLTFVLVFAAPASIRYIALFPEHVTDNGYVWLFLTYAAMPFSIVNLVLVATLMLWFGWYVEPVVGTVRYILLVVGSALCSGLTYFLFGAQSSLPLVGGLFALSAVGIAFLLWSVPNRSQFGQKLKLFWALAVCWIAYTLWASPLSLSAVHIVAWCVGALLAIGPIRRSARSPNNALVLTKGVLL